LACSLCLLSEAPVLCQSSSHFGLLPLQPFSLRLLLCQLLRLLPLQPFSLCPRQLHLLHHLLFSQLQSLRCQPPLLPLSPPFFLFSPFHLSAQCSLRRSLLGHILCLHID
jgi:hypothetical protein